MAGDRPACEFRFYEELNDFLPPALRRTAFLHAFDGTPSVKDRIESLGVPHTEVDLILVDGESVGFGHRLRGGERVAVYPVFERFDLVEATRLRPTPLREPRFVLDVHLGRLAAYLRLLGFDCVYANDLADERIIAIARAEHRIVLTRDRGILKDGRVTHGAYLHATRPLRQAREVVDRFQLERRMRPFTRCARCNTPLEWVPRERVADRLPDPLDARQQTFRHCPGCDKVYWRGSHLDRLRRRLAGAGIDIGDA